MTGALLGLLVAAAGTPQAPPIFRAEVDLVRVEALVTRKGAPVRGLTAADFEVRDGGWPEQEAHFNSRYSWANAEFTPRQTMRGKMLLYAYLHALTKDTDR